jgi:hypothetical protein
MNVRLTVLAAAAAGLLVGPACAGRKAENAAPPQPAATPSDTQPSTVPRTGSACPMQVPGTTMSVIDTSNGVAMVFSNEDASQAAELQRHVLSMAQMHNACAEGASSCPRGMMGHGMMGGGEPSGAYGGGPKMSSHAEVQNTENGARLILTPDTPAQLESLRTSVRQHAAHMAAGTCGMMKHGEQP